MSLQLPLVVENDTINSENNGSIENTTDTATEKEINILTDVNIKIVQQSMVGFLFCHFKISEANYMQVRIIA